MDKAEVVKKVAGNGLLMILGTGLLAMGTKGIEEVTPVVVNGIKSMIKIKR